MKTILIANQKGGVGKTTIADEIAFALERRGYSVCFTNIDPQGGAVHNPSMPDDKDDFQVVDTPGAISPDFQKWCRHSDIIIMPTTPSMLDLIPLQRCYELARKSGTKAAIGFVVNNYDPRREVDRDFIEFLNNAKMPIWATIPTATAVRKAQAARMSVEKFEKRSPAAAAFEEITEKTLKEIKK